MKYDYQIVTSENKWEGGGTQATMDEIMRECSLINIRLKQDGRDEELVVFYSPKMEQFTFKK